MKILILVVVALCTSLTMVTEAFATDLCVDPLQNQSLCFKMKALRSQLDLLDAQRDLMRVNYNYLYSVGGDMNLLVAEILKEDPAGHIGSLNTLQDKIGKLLLQSGRQNSEALAIANSLKSDCMSCHTNQSPTSGYKWDEISGNNWDKITVYCNNQTASPYLCKSMHGMRTVYGYYIAAFLAGHKNYDLAALSSLEIKRIATDLIGKHFDHASPQVLADVVSASDEITGLAMTQNPKTFEKTMAVSRDCAKCHQR